LLNAVLHPVRKLPGVFEHNPYPYEVNGSLWTLAYEAACYTAVLLLGVLRAPGRSAAMVLFVTNIIVAPSGSLGLWAPMPACFAAGMLLYRFQPPHDWRLAIGTSVVLMAGFAAGQPAIGFVVGGSYLVYYLALNPSIRLPRAARYGDLSYGI